MRLRIINEGISPKDLTALKQRDKVDYRKVVKDSKFKKILKINHNIDLKYVKQNVYGTLYYDDTVSDEAEWNEFVKYFSDGRDIDNLAIFSLLGTSEDEGGSSLSDNYNHLKQKADSYERILQKDIMQIQQLAVRNIDNPDYGIMLISAVHSSKGDIVNPCTSDNSLDYAFIDDLVKIVAVLYDKKNYKILADIDFADFTRDGDLNQKRKFFIAKSTRLGLDR